MSVLLPPFSDEVFITIAFLVLWIQTRLIPTLLRHIYNMYYGRWQLPVGLTFWRLGGVLILCIYCFGNSMIYIFLWSRLFYERPPLWCASLSYTLKLFRNVNYLTHKIFIDYNTRLGVGGTIAIRGP